MSSALPPDAAPPSTSTSPSTSPSPTSPSASRFPFQQHQLTQHLPHPPSPLSHSTLNPLDALFPPSPAAALANGNANGNGKGKHRPLSLADAVGDRDTDRDTDDRLRYREDDRDPTQQRRGRSPDPSPTPQHVLAGPSASPTATHSSISASVPASPASPPQRTGTASSGSRTRRPPSNPRQKPPSPRHSLDRGTNPGTNPNSHAHALPAPAAISPLPSGAQAPDPHHPFPNPEIAQLQQQEMMYAAPGPSLPAATAPAPAIAPTQPLSMSMPMAIPMPVPLPMPLPRPVSLQPSLPALRRPASGSFLPSAPLPIPVPAPIQLLTGLPGPAHAAVQLQAQSQSQGQAQGGATPAYVPPPPIVQPEGEVCLECLMRDREMADVDVLSPGVWARASDVWYEELVRREEEEGGEEERERGERGERAMSEESSAGGSGSGEGRAGQGHALRDRERERIRAKGQVLSEHNLKVWGRMNPKEPASRWHALHAYVRAQKMLAEAESSARREAEREARLLDARVKSSFSQVLREDQAASVVSSPALNGTWGVKVRVGLGAGGAGGGKENGGIWGTKRKKRESGVISGERERTQGQGERERERRDRDVTLLQNGLLVEHVDLRKAREAEERELAREEREREKRRRTLSRVSFTGLGLGQPRSAGVGKGERASSYGAPAGAGIGPPTIGGAGLGAYATTPWRASASASQPTLLPPTSPGLAHQHPYGYPFPTRPYAQQQHQPGSPSASSRRLSSPLSSPNPHLPALGQGQGQAGRRESPRSSGEVPPGFAAGGGGGGGGGTGLGVGLGLGRWSAGRFWAHQGNGSEWSLGVMSGMSGAGSGGGSMVDMHLGLDLEKQAMARAEAQANALAMAEGGAGRALRASPEPMSPVVAAGQGQGQGMDDVRHAYAHGPPGTPADAVSLATATSATTKKKSRGFGGIWKKLKGTTGRKDGGAGEEVGADAEKRSLPSSAPVVGFPASGEELDSNEHLPPLAPPPPLSYLVNRRSAERSPSLSRPSSVAVSLSVSLSSPSCSSPRSLSFSNPALPFGAPEREGQSYGSPATAPTSLSVDPAHGSRITSPAQSVRKLSAEMMLPLPAQLESPLLDSPTLELLQNPMGTPSPSNTIVHNSTTANAHAAQNGNANGNANVGYGSVRQGTPSKFKSLPPLPGQEAQQRPPPVGVQSDPVAPTQPPLAQFMGHARGQSYDANIGTSWPTLSRQYSPPNLQQQQQQQSMHAPYPEPFPEYARSGRSVAASRQYQQDEMSEKRSPRSHSRPRFNFAAFLRRKSFVRSPEPQEEPHEQEYFVPEPNGYPSFEPPRLPFTPAAHYASDMSQSQSSLSSHRPPSSIVGSGSINRTSMLSAKIPQSDDFVAYRYPSLEQPVELLRR